jgi:hypothetical protein
MTDDPSDDLLVDAKERKQLKGEYKVLFEGVSSILFKHDPIGLNFEENIDEYDPEARTLLPRLPKCSSAADVQNALHEEFVRWFAPDLAGSPETYADAAAEIWALWLARGAELPAK